MNMNDYQKLAMRTMPKDLTNSGMVTMCTMGIAGESGEVCDLIKKSKFHDEKIHRLDCEGARPHPSLTLLMKEMGDVLWYLAGMAEAYNCSLQDIAEMNIDKLKRRWPNGFMQGEKRECFADFIVFTTVVCETGSSGHNHDIVWKKSNEKDPSDRVVKGISTRYLNLIGSAPIDSMRFSLTNGVSFLIRESIVLTDQLLGASFNPLGWARMDEPKRRDVANAFAEWSIELKSLSEDDRVMALDVFAFSLMLSAVSRWYPGNIANEDSPTEVRSSQVTRAKPGKESQHDVEWEMVRTVGSGIAVAEDITTEVVRLSKVSLLRSAPAVRSPRVRELIDANANLLVEFNGHRFNSIAWARSSYKEKIRMAIRVTDDIDECKDLRPEDRIDIVDMFVFSFLVEKVRDSQTDESFSPKDMRSRKFWGGLGPDLGGLDEPIEYVETGGGANPDVGIKGIGSFGGLTDHQLEGVVRSLAYDLDRNPMGLKKTDKPIKTLKDRKYAVRGFTDVTDAYSWIKSLGQGFNDINPCIHTGLRGVNPSLRGWMDLSPEEREGQCRRISKRSYISNEISMDEIGNIVDQACFFWIKSYREQLAFMEDLRGDSRD